MAESRANPHHDAPGSCHLGPHGSSLSLARLEREGGGFVFSPLLCDTNISSNSRPWRLGRWGEGFPDSRSGLAPASRNRGVEGHHGHGVWRHVSHAETGSVAKQGKQTCSQDRQGCPVLCLSPPVHGSYVGLYPVLSCSRRTWCSRAAPIRAMCVHDVGHGHGLRAPCPRHMYMSKETRRRERQSGEPPHVPPRHGVGSLPRQRGGAACRQLQVPASGERGRGRMGG